MVSSQKQTLVRNLTELACAYPVIALADLQNLPAPQLQNIRPLLRQKGIILTMARKRLLTLALKNSHLPQIDALLSKMKGLPALLLSKEDPFTLYSLLQKNKSSAPAKAGQLAPRDIIIPAGPTNFAPGPIISELAAVGIKTKVEGGKLAIPQDTVVVREGQPISPKLAETLKRLDIQPMEIGLNIVAAWENQLVFDASQLYINEEEYFQHFVLAHLFAFALAMEAAYPLPETIEPLIQKAFRESKTLASEQKIFTDLTAADFLAQAESQALSLKETAGLEIPEKPVFSSPPSEHPLAEKTKDKETESSLLSPSPADDADPSIPSAHDLIKAAREKFAPLSPQAPPLPSPSLSAAHLLDEVQPKKDPGLAQAEALYQQLKKQGTLR